MAAYEYNKPHEHFWRGNVPSSYKMEYLVYTAFSTERITFLNKWNKVTVAPAVNMQNNFPIMDECVHDLNTQEGHMYAPPCFLI